MVYQSFKSRKLDKSLPIKMYKNLHNGMFSLQQNGKVVAHVNNVILKDVKFKVSKSGRQRVLQEKKKNVHAFVIGYIVDVNTENHKSDISISYNPYKSDKFYFKHNDNEAFLCENEMLYCSSTDGLFVIAK